MSDLVFGSTEACSNQEPTLTPPSCGHAALAALAGRDGSGVSSGEASSEADRAMALLTKAVAMGFRNAAAFRTETSLHSLRNRPDFQLLILDLAFPARPFARGR